MEIIRLYTYKSFRHYGGREITTKTHLCRALFVDNQTDGTVLFQLLDDCAGYKKGNKVSILAKDIIK